MSWEIAIVFGIISTAFILMYLALNLDSKHAPIKFFLIMVSLFMLISELALNQQLVQANTLNIGNQTVTDNLILSTRGFYQTGIIIGTLILSYFLIFLILGIISRIGKGGNPEEEFNI